MKKFISLITVALMLSLLVSTMLTPASAADLKSVYANAKDGDLLYELKFDGSDGIYTPSLFYAKNEGDNVPEAVAISDNGRTLAFTKPSGESNASWFGGRINGLSMANGEKYTITMKACLPEKRAGVYCNFPTEIKEVEVAGSIQNYLYGIYGGFGIQGNLRATKSGSRIAGTYKFNASSDSTTTPMITAEQFVDLTFLIEDNSYAVFVNNTFIDVVSYPADAKGAFDDLGFSVYLYHIDLNAPMIIKDVNVYKGDTVSATATYERYAKDYKHYKAPETTQKPETTKAPDTTAAPVTNAPEATTQAPTTNKPAETKDNTAAQKGCGGMVAGGLTVVAMIAIAAITMRRKD